MKKYIKRPVPIEAIMWTGKNEKEVLDFLEWKNAEVTEGEMYIFTLEGRMHVSLGDYVIKGTHGEFYPCKPEIFNSNYIEQEDHVQFLSFEAFNSVKYLLDRFIQNSTAIKSIPVENKEDAMGVQFNGIKTIFRRL